YAYCLGKPAAFIVPTRQPGRSYLASATITRELCKDPYSVDPNVPLPSRPFGIIAVPAPAPIIKTYIESTFARIWELSGNSFRIEVNVDEILSKFGRGVYTVVVSGEMNGESMDLTNFSIFVRSLMPWIP
ncbi:MAG: hypothetical protein Q7R34_05015, partial [Dehalococcoidia bacterium]|nr:hypothetical protein [Dehalococcoidia bacterium]